MSDSAFVRFVRGVALGRRTVEVRASDYKFGDLTKKLMKSAKESLDKAGKEATGNSAYEFGDYTKSLLAGIQAKAGQLDLATLSRQALEKLMSYEFGDISRAVLHSEVGRQLLSTATEAGRRISGDENYQVGDFTRRAMLRLESAKTRAEKVAALPDDVAELKQILLEQQLLIQSLAGEQYSTPERVDQVLRIEGSADDLKPTLLDNQEVIDVLLSSKDG